MSDKKEFYRRLAENSLKGVKTQRTIKTTRTNTPNHTTRNNNYRNTIRNGMIKFEEQNNTQPSSKFFIQCIISILIIGVFYYLSNSNSEMAKNIVSKTKSIINSELNINNKINDILLKFNIRTNIENGNKDGVSIDSEVIEQMEKEIENAPKK